MVGVKVFCIHILEGIRWRLGRWPTGRVCNIVTFWQCNNVPLYQCNSHYLMHRGEGGSWNSSRPRTARSLSVAHLLCHNLLTHMAHSDHRCHHQNPASNVTHSQLAAIVCALTKLPDLFKMEVFPTKFDENKRRSLCINIKTFSDSLIAVVTNQNQNQPKSVAEASLMFMSPHLKFLGQTVSKCPSV